MWVEALYAAAAAAAAAAWLHRRRVWLLWCCCVLITRGQCRRVGPAVPRRRRREPHRAFDCRAPAPPHVAAGPLSSVASLLSSHGPCFGVRGADVDVLHTPADFYRRLLDMIDAAESTIHIAALYLGCSKMCKEIADRLDAALRRTATLTATLLIDYGRGMRAERDGTTVLSVLAPLVAAHGDRVRVRLFMVPLCGAAFRHAPPSIREVAGVQHIKAYIADDDALVSGANLNDDYFTDRQDRYVGFRAAPALAGWLRQLLDALAGLAFDAVPAGGDGAAPELAVQWRSAEPHPVWSGPSPRVTHEFAEAARLRVDALLAEEGDPRGEAACGAADTFVWPLVQMAPLGVEHDAALTPQLLASLPPEGYRCALSSAYPNFTGPITRALRDAEYDCTVLAPREEANGFFEAGGAKKWVPRAYTALLRGFLRRAGARVALTQWLRRGWTYHAKGLWALPVQRGAPALTLVGSSNLGRRSEDLDLELQLAVVSHDPGLCDRLRGELAALQLYAEEAQGERELRESAGGPWRRGVATALSKITQPFL